MLYSGWEVLCVLYSWWEGVLCYTVLVCVVCVVQWVGEMVIYCCLCVLFSVVLSCVVGCLTWLMCCASGGIVFS